MSALCTHKNPLQHSGTSQYRRILAALLPASAKVDERDDADFILFAKNYAAYLNYYDATNRADGNWVPLMKMDVSVILATIAKQDAQLYYKYISSLYQEINKLFQDGNEAGMKEKYKFIFDFMITLIYELNEHLNNLPDETGFKEFLQLTIQSKLADLKAKLFIHFDASNTELMLDGTATALPNDAPVVVRLTQNLRQNNLSSYWSSAVPFTPPIHAGTVAVKIRNTINHGVFKGIIETFFKVYSLIIKFANQHLQATLESFPAHTPHYALYLTFIKLFRYAQDHLNEFTDRHLKLYFKEILQVKTLAAVPDKVHILFELQKNVTQHLLKKDTVLKAGKDVAGNELFYALTDDIVVNTGVVKSIKSIFTKKNKSGGKEYVTVYKAPVANSADGKGEKLNTPDQSWKPFGNITYNDTAIIGFALAHPALFLKEGARKITVSVKGNNYATLSGISKDYFTANLTGEEGWQEARVVAVSIAGAYLKFVLQLESDAQAIVPYNEKIHAAGYQVALPVLQLFAKNLKGQFNFLKPLAELLITEVKLELDVIGIKDLAIQNELSALDPAKPFQMFGPQPRIGSSFIIGSNEAFLKATEKDTTITLHLEWDKTDASVGFFYDPYLVNKNITIEFLEDGNWKTNLNDAGRTQMLFSYTKPTVVLGKAEKNVIDELTIQQLFIHKNETLKFILPQSNSAYSFAENIPYEITSRNGYFRLNFNGPTDFGHSDYIKRFTQASLDKATLPNEPYTPSVKSISLDYICSVTLDLNIAGLSDKTGYFLHINAFGNSIQFKSSAGAIPLIPVFPDEGELFIGLENFKADQSINLLFKVSEGSADSAKERQEVRWSYLAKNNQWRFFEQGNVIDQTNDLTQSGIIKFAFPEEATDQNTLMGEQLFWIKGAVTKDTEAVCDLIAIHAQAATAQLTDHNKTGLEYTSVLPANTISKLLLSDSAIKKISQPYTSWAGKMREPDGQFFTRVSERLRHKKRGITIWDYERLVLQQFPEIYKVKCISHAKLNTGGSSVNELAPGHVMVIPVPDLRGLNAINPLRPQTSLGTLVDIKSYLQKHISPFVKLDVKNALFEEIQLDFKVQFRTEDGAFYHHQLVDEIEQYLSPWAFDATREIEFGGKISKSKLLNFIEERNYVDYITCFKMYHIVEGVKSADVEEAAASSPHSVFVGYGGIDGKKETKHLIDYLNPDCNC